MEILIIYSSRIGQLRDAMKYLSRKFPASTFTILSPNQPLTELGECVKRIIFLDRTHISFLNLPKGLIRKLRGDKFDGVAILYNNSFGKGYSNINLMVSMIKPKRVFTFSIKGEVHEFPYLAWLLRPFINFLTTILLLPYAFLLIIYTSLRTYIRHQREPYKLPSKGRLKLCFLGDGRSPHLRKWLSYFTNKGYEVHLLTDTPCSYQEVKIHHFEFEFDLAPYRFMILRFLKTYLKLKRLIHKIRPHLIYSHFLQPYSIWGVLLNFHPHFIHLWGSDVLVAFDKPEQLPKGYFLLSKAALRDAELVFVCSPNLLNRVKEIRGGETKIFSWGVDIGKFNPKIRSKHEGRVVISTRYWKPLYNIETLIKAIPMVVKEHPNIKFILLSGGEEEQFLSNLIRKLGVEEKIDLIGYVDDESYIKYLAASDIIISIPSTDATSISLLEGMAIGLYPIATDIPANREWIRDGENGTLVRVGDFHALAEAILEAVRDGGEHFIKENYNLIKKRANFSHQMQIFEEKYLLRDA